VRPGLSGICQSTLGNWALNEPMTFAAVSFFCRFSEYEPGGGTRRIGFWPALGVAVPYILLFHQATKSLSAACATVIVAAALPRERSNGVGASP
jgi:hypothetical protein